MPFLASTNAVRLQSTKARCAYPTTASFLQRFDIFFVDRWPIGISGKLRFAAENQPRPVLRFALTRQPCDNPSAFADKDRLAALMHLVNQRKTTISAVCVVSLIVGLNVFLIVQSLA